MKELKELNKYFLKYRFRMITGVIIIISAKIVVLFIPQLFGEAISLIAEQAENPLDKNNFKIQLTQKIAWILGAALVNGILIFLMRQTIINVSRYVEFDLKNEIYQHYQKLSLNFYKKNRTGDLMSRITEDVSKVRLYFGPAIMYSINTITLFTIALTYMFQKAPLLSFYTILPLPILSITIYFLSKKINVNSKNVQEHLAKLSSFVQETFSGITVMKSYVLEPINKSDFNYLAQQQKKKRLQLSIIQAFFYPLMLLLIGTSNLIVIYIGGQQYISGQIENIGTIAEFIIYVNMLTWPVASIGWVSSMVQEAEASQGRINHFLKQKPEIVNTIAARQNIKGDIEFEDVHFSYPDTNIKALKGISFLLKEGQTLAIIGKTGSGKSTILELIGRLYEPNSGNIKLDGNSIEKLNLFDLRNSIGYVPQDPFLFSESIESNIKFGAASSSKEQVIATAKKAAVHENIVQFKRGYQTILGERGITLSGGQKQRISIARALIKNSPILLLDDCLSAVDTKTEEKILSTLNKEITKKTAIIVSHRISSIKNADHIIVLEEGRIIQAGTHQQLISIKGYYKELFQKQLLEFNKENARDQDGST
jgi:ATP-binding cassette subfamily B protein